jgi:hypothetical protein
MMNMMNTTSMTRAGRGRRFVLTAAASLALAAPLAQAEMTTGAFEMVVYTGSTQGEHLIEGDWEAAMALDEAVSKTRFAALNDRCVSLTVARDLERAEVVCNDAVRAARRSGASNAPGYVNRGIATDSRTNRAMAHTNRGVLHALQGEGEKARADFETAMDLSATIVAAAANLEVLDARPNLASAD